MKKYSFLALLLVALLTFGLFTACDPVTDSTVESTPPVESSIDPQPPVPPTPEVVYGLPVAEVGRYIKDADVVDDGDTRVLLYTTNGEIAEDDNVIATRSASFVEGEGWLYGEESIAIVGEVNGWDEFIGSASIVKGTFEYGDANYSWLMAYCATPNANETQYEIGLAVASEIGGTWVKVGDRALIEYNEAVYGSGCVGCYAPSLVNLNKQSAIRIYYTYADIYGHFTQFVDINAADLDVLYTDAAKTDVNLISGSNQIPTNGNLSGGDAALMFPNADFAHEANGKVYAVKDYSPSAAATPAYAEKIELGSIDESELYTVALLNGWASLRLWDMFDTPEMAYERLYSACVVADAFGYVAEGADIEIIYNVCDVAQDNADWLFSQNLLTFVYER